MADAYTLILDSAYPETVKGPAGQIARNRYVVSMAGCGMETEEEWSSTDAAAVLAWKPVLLADERVAALTIEKRGGEPIVISVRWCYDRTDPAWTIGADQALWNIDLIETSQPLRSHPYFGRRPDPTLASTLQSYMAEADAMLERGQDFTAPGTSPEMGIMQRYNALRRAGAEEWAPVVVVLSQRFRLFKSQTGDQPPPKQSYKYLLRGINSVQTLAAIAPPSDVMDALAGMEQIGYGVLASTTPTRTYDATQLAWVRMKPAVQLSGNNPNGPRDVTLRWIGFQQASAVLYPLAVPGSTPVLWDPM